jgi:hypothetical protein
MSKIIRARRSARPTLAVAAASTGMGDNDGRGGFMAPGATGTPTLTFSDPCQDATLTPAPPASDPIAGCAAVRPH